MPPSLRPDRIDDRAFGALLTSCAPALRAFVRRLVPQAADADDVVQEAMARAWRRRDGFRADGNGRAWLQRIAFRVACDQRRRRRDAAALDGLGEARAARGEPAADAGPCPVELGDELRRHLLPLGGLEKELLLGFHRDGLSLRELGARHGLPLNTVKSHLHRARRRLHERLREPRP